MLRAGALPAGLLFLEERTIGPELGADSIRAGKIACVVAFGAVLIFMAASYGLFGLFANVALLLNRFNFWLVIWNRRNINIAGNSWDCVDHWDGR